MKKLLVIAKMLLSTVAFSTTRTQAENKITVIMHVRVLGTSSLQEQVAQPLKGARVVAIDRNGVVEDTGLTDTSGGMGTAILQY